MLIAARNGMMVKYLPYDSEVEYLESTGTQWIDTGIYFREKARVVARLTLVNNQDRDIIGTPSASAGSFILDFGGSSRDTLYYKYGGLSKSVRVGKIQNLLIDIDASDTVIINGDTYVYPSDVSGWSFNSATQILSLFKGRNYDTGRIYHVRLYDGATLVRDFTPVRKGNVGYMYDRVTGRLFGNAGTGDFVLGPDVVPVEYIESHGTELIDTGVELVSTSRMVADIKFESVNATMLSGVWGPNSRFQFGILRGVFTLGIGSVGTDTIAADTLRHIFALDANTKTASIDSNQYLLSSAIISFEQKSIPIFVQLSAQNNVFANYCSAKLYAYQLFDAGTLVRSFRAVRVGTGSTWEGAMMDVLTRRVYRNAGSGAFTYGPDK